jgi:hypothetical protein
MINRSQARELLENARSARYARTPGLLEAVYAAADPATKAILNANPDLRVKAHQAAESHIRAEQDQRDYQAVLQAVQEQLEPSLKKESDGYGEDEAL